MVPNAKYRITSKSTIKVYVQYLATNHFAPYFIAYEYKYLKSYGMPTNIRTRDLGIKRKLFVSWSWVCIFEIVIINGFTFLKQSSLIIT